MKPSSRSVVLAEPSAYRKHEHFAFAVQQLAHAIRGERSAFAIVSGDETDNIFRLQTRVDDDCGHTGAFGFVDGTHQRAIVERREHDAAHTLRGESFDDLNLLFAIVFAERAFPDDFYFSALRR